MCQHVKDPAVFKQSLQGKLLYKDECSLCFHPSTEAGGVNLCLSCFECGCETLFAKGSDLTHTSLHTRKFGHSLFLNIQKFVEKITIPGQDITKIAIGTPGGGGMDLERVTYKYALFCLSCNVRLSEPPTEYAGLIKSIEQHQSAYEKAQIVSWELEQNPCPHSRQIEQAPSPLPGDHKIQENAHNRDINRCTDCDLSTNLWLCLTCGNIGCGRRNFDGTGGNGHGLAHFDKTKHPVSVKTGTISPTETPSSYCYLCNDDVKVPHVMEYLKVLGLNPAIMRKTEKTMNEMSLEYNLNLKLSEAFEKSGQYEPILVKQKPLGLTNIGNSCYINSVLQCLASVPEFVQMFSLDSPAVRAHIESGCTERPSECLVCQLAKVVNLFVEGTEHKEALDVRPYIFRHLIGRDHLEFRTQRQQDAAEYLVHLLQILKSAEKTLKTDFSSLFRFKALVKLNCAGGCGSYYLRESTGLIFDLNFGSEALAKLWAAPEGQSTEIALKELLEAGVEQPGEEVLDCAECHGKRIFKSRVYLTHFPKYLVVRVQNFVQEHFQVKKIHPDLRFDLASLDLSVLDSKSALHGAGRKLEAAQGSENINASLLAELRSMGFSESRARRALRESNNNLEAAINLLFSVEGDPEFDKPADSLKKIHGNSSAEDDQLTQEALMILGDAGFNQDYIRKVCFNFSAQGLDYIVSYLYENPQDNFTLQDPTKKAEAKTQVAEPELGEDDGARVYQALGAVVHLGKAVHAGHYVAFAKRKIEGQTDWVYFNDHQVFYARLPNVGRAYLLFLEKI